MPEATTGLTIRTLGAFGVEHDGLSLSERLPIKTLLMVTYLACAPAMHARDDIRDLLWGSDRLTSGSTNLRVALSTARRVLGSTLEINRHSLGIAPAASLCVDATAMEAAILTAQQRAAQTPLLDDAACQELTTGLGRYQGDFLRETTPANAPRFETWRKYQQAKFQALAHHGYALLTEQLVAKGLAENAIEAAEQWQKIDELDELPYRTLIRLHARMGRIEEARNWYDIYRSTVFESLHLPPSEEMRSLHASLIDKLAPSHHDLRRPSKYAPHHADSRPAAVSRASEPEGVAVVPPNNLGTHLPTLYGREGELEMLSRLIGSGQHRLLTLTGIDGIGKTCLARALAHHLLHTARTAAIFKDGIFFISLEDSRAEATSLAALAGDLRLAASDRGRPLLALIEEYLAERRCLLILDGVQPQQASVEFVAALVAKAPGLSVLATSTQEIGLAGEATFPLGGLDISYVDFFDDSPHDFPACRLFFDYTAGSSQPFTAPNVIKSVMKICQMVEGIPLAIQLVAGMTKSNGVDELFIQLKRKLARYTAAEGLHPDTILGEVLDMAWQRLDPWLQRAYLRLTAFGGTFTATAASSAALVMANQMAELQRASLIQAVQQMPPLPAVNEPRYCLHPALRAFASEALVTSNAQDAAQRRHYEYFARFLAQHDVTAGGPDLASRLDALDSEIQNLSLALAHASTNGSWTAVRDGALCLGIYFTLRGSFVRATILLDDIQRSLPEPLPQDAAAALAALQLAQAIVQNRYGNYAAAADDARAALKGSHQDRELEMVAHLELGRAGFFTAQYADARSDLENALHLAQVAGLAHWECRVLSVLGLTLLYCGEHERGIQLSNVALQLSRKHLLIVEEGRLLNQLGMVFYYQGRFPSATQHYEHALRSAGRCGDSTTLIATTISLGAIAQQLGDYSRAITLYRNALHMIDESGDRGNEAIALANLGMSLHYLGDNEDGLLYLKRAEVVAQRRVQRDVEAFVFTAEGHTHFALGQLPEAEDCFGKALQLRLALQQAQQAMEPLAGLAEVALTRGEVAAALAYAERMLPVVRSPWFAAAVEFFRVYWACYKALDASDDARASELLTDAYQRLMARAAQIEDDTMRAGYLDRIAVHRAIAESYAAHLHTNGK